MKFREELVASKWLTTGYIGHGSFSTVYSAIGDDRQLVAIKMAAKYEDNYNDMEYEYEQLCRIYVHAGKSLLVQDNNFPIIRPIFCGLHQGQDVFVMSPLGTCLETHHINVGRNTLKYVTVYRVAVQIIDALRIIHQAGIVHMEVQPSHIIAGTNAGDNSKVFLTDFGNSESFLDHQTN